MGHVRERTTKRVHVPAHWFLSLVYHDVFGYPLTRKELVRWATPRQEGVFPAEKTGEYYHMVGRAYLVLLRKEREVVSSNKHVIAQHGAHVFSRIPMVRFIGITGSLAMGNADKKSDIDLFIITTAGTLWITRLLVRVVSLLGGVKLRKVGGSEHKDSLCLNMWMDEENLRIPHVINTRYTAHEVLQVVPLVNKDNTFERFLRANEWARNYWPSAKSRSKIYDLGFRNKNFFKSYLKQSEKQGSMRSIGSYFLNLTSKLLVVLEPLAYRLQQWYMRNRHTRELIEPGRAFFHPIDWGGIVLGEFERRAKSEKRKLREPRLLSYPLTK